MHEQHRQQLITAVRQGYHLFLILFCAFPDTVPAREEKTYKDLQGRKDIKHFAVLNSTMLRATGIKSFLLSGLLYLSIAT